MNKTVDGLTDARCNGEGEGIVQLGNLLCNYPTQRGVTEHKRGGAVTGWGSGEEPVRGHGADVEFFRTVNTGDQNAWTEPRRNESRNSV